MESVRLYHLGQEMAVGMTHNPLLSTQQEERRVEKVRRMLGEDVRNLSDSELEVFLTKFNFLLDSWLDGYEQSVFDGKTLKELLQEG